MRTVTRPKAAKKGHQGAGYAEFLTRKADVGGDGFEPVWVPDALFDFQAHLTGWAIRRGRAALFEDCGLGKTPQQLVWAENVVRHANRPVLVLTPLAVAPQTVREGEKFGVEVERLAARPEKYAAKVYVTNYEKLEKFDPADFAGVVGDESGVLKDFDGTTRTRVTEFARQLRYRLFCSATPSPNDYIELGTHSEALGELGRMDMLARFFKSQDGSLHPHRRDLFSHAFRQDKWRFKGHAEGPFWRWVCSWARACRKPSDLGYDDGRFVLPKLTTTEHVVPSLTLRPGYLFPVPAVGLREEKEERRRTIKERCERAAEIVAARPKEAAVVWCHLNDEGDLLTDLIPGAVQVSGRDSDEAKEEKFRAFESGEILRLVLKPKIGAWGLNWQHCRRVVTFPGHSFEQYYQLVRRCWRFGQTKPVTVDVIASDGEAGVVANMQRKAEAADRMFSALVSGMTDALRLDRGDDYPHPVEVPSWL